MSRTAVNTRDTPRPGAVTVSCDNCGGQFTTDESTAYQADQRDEDLLCKPCKNGQPAPPSKALEDPEIDAIREDLQYNGLGPDAEPPIEANAPDNLDVGGCPSVVEVELTKGTKSLGTIEVSLDYENRGLYLPVSLEPSTAIYDEAVQDAVVSGLSLQTQHAIRLKDPEEDR
ncbi:hypothetical protein ACODNH_21280 (plasmid) [Haloarcula sp. NS06]|uniref:hypothetical protein n=1 Tax=Haloarcula sp. NS06 TaxID=3409688 RepID=UPI003DA7576F